MKARKEINPICRRNRKIIDQCKTAEEIFAVLCTISPMGIYNQAWYDRFEISKTCIVPSEGSDEEIEAAQQKYLAEEYTSLMMKRRQRKAKAEARKNAPKPATKKPRHAKKLDDSRQILIQFDEPENTPAPFLPAKPKTRRTRKPRVKRDYSRQILIDFGEDIPGSQNNKRIAA